MLDYVTSWERKGIEKGIQEGLAIGLAEGIEKGIERGIETGIAKGRAKGRAEVIDTLRAVLLDVLTSRFGTLNDKVVQRVAAIDTPDQLRRLTQQALEAASLHDLNFC